MFCSTLRQRPDIASTNIISTLTSSTDPHLQETALNSHDLALPVPAIHQHHQHHQAPQTLPPPHHQHQTSTSARFLLLTPLSTSSQGHKLATLERVSRLTTSGGSDSENEFEAVVMIMQTGAPEGIEIGVGMAAYLELQAMIHPLPFFPPPLILPIPSPAHLLSSLRLFLNGSSLKQRPPPPRRIMHPGPAPTLAPASASLTAQRELLPQATSTAPHRPLSEHDAFVLGDLCRSLRQVAEMVETGPGREVLADHLGYGVMRGVREFWEDEWVCE